MSECVHPRRAEFDKFDDGDGPYMERELIRLSGDSAAPPYWDEFKTWADEELGQGYSLACADGSILDAVTRWCFVGYRAGRKWSAEGAASEVPPVPDGAEATGQHEHQPRSVGAPAKGER